MFFSDFPTKGWTTTHGYFTQMGGFMLFEGDTRKGVLMPWRLGDLLKKGKIKFPNITEEEIQDRSKGDALSKTLVIGQTTWFVAQCISRQAQGLVTTELELVTLGFAVLNAFMYYFWWNKPLGVQTSVPVYLLDRNNAESATTTGIGATGDAYSTLEVNTVGEIFGRLADMTTAGDPYINETGTMQMHTFYAMPITEWQDLNLTGCVSLIGVVFGAIHCAGWNFLFPSHAELILWRISSLVIIVVPLSMVLANYLAWMQGGTETLDITLCLGS
ncbi:hypothetical protein BDZ97DRAFT_2027258 [Flammula alnicola]|nr:hypothetical protein BDZ97DRAFT_2027258 [Flammula alnicola]